MSLRTPFEPSRIDPRCSSSLYLPDRTSDVPMSLLVAVHGTGREAEDMQEGFAPFADRHGVAVLSPLFPAWPDDPDGADAFKWVEHRGVRFDRILLGMIDDACERWPLYGDRVLLAGFSGEAQLVHRFAYLHPERLRAAVVAAPGRITLPDDEPWPFGLGDVRQRFGSSPDLDGLRAVPVQVVVGSDDAAELPRRGADPREFRPGSSRAARARTLAAALAAVGVIVRFDTVAGAGHDLEALTPAMVDFLEGVA